MSACVGAEMCSCPSARVDDFCSPVYARWTVVCVGSMCVGTICVGTRFVGIICVCTRNWYENALVRDALDGVDCLAVSDTSVSGRATVGSQASVNR